MAYTADGVLGAENYEILKRRLSMMQTRLDHANDRYHRAREMINFYQVLGAEDAKAVIDRYRIALIQIAEMERRDKPCDAEMAAIARRAIDRG